MFHFVYKTINSINGKFYIGKHSTDNLDDGYIGSGYALQRAVAKYGKDAFSTTVLKFFDSQELAYQFERELILAEGLSNPMCYNLCGGGMGFWKGMKPPTKQEARYQPHSKAAESLKVLARR